MTTKPLEQMTVEELREEVVQTSDFRDQVKAFDELARRNKLLMEARREALESLIEPTKEMIEAGAQRLARWEDGCTWPDSWDGLQVVGMRTDAERVWRSMIVEALKEKAS